MSEVGTQSLSVLQTTHLQIWQFLEKQKKWLLVTYSVHVHVDDSFCKINNNYKLKVPTTIKLKTLGNKAFNLDGPSLFKTLPIVITTNQKVQGFKQGLKIF